MTNLDIQKAYLGLDEVDKVYLGSEVIWPTEIDYSTEPLTLKAVGSSPAYITVNSRYSGGTVYYRENGGAWSALSPGQRLDLFVGTPVQLMGYSGATSLFSGGTQGGTYEVYGNVMSLIYGENFIGQTTIPSGLVDCFYSTFRKCQSLVSIKNLVMPATTLSQGCYRSMFNKCWYLTELPDVFIPSGAILTSACCRYTFEELGASASTPVEVPFGFLPSTNIAERCYEGMFKGSNILSAPELPATTLAPSCYMDMFRNCTSLATAPELPATILTDYCYNGMFSGCTSLTTAPELPATILAQNCYRYMFYGCRSLNYITCLATDIFANTCTTGWVVGVASTGTFIKAASMTGWGTGANGIPTGWTVQDYVEPNNS